MSEKKVEDAPITSRKVIQHIVTYKNKKEKESVEFGNELTDEEVAENVRNKAIIQTMALKAYEDRQKLLAQKYPKYEDQIYQAETGPSLDAMERLLEKVKNPLKRSSPTGKIGLDITGKGKTGPATSAQLIDNLYEELDLMRFNKTFGKDKYDYNRHMELESMADKLLLSAVKGERSRDKITGFDLWNCPKCGRTIMSSDTCDNPECKYVQTYDKPYKFQDYDKRAVKGDFIIRGRRR